MCFFCITNGEQGEDWLGTCSCCRAEGQRYRLCVGGVRGLIFNDQGAIMDTGFGTSIPLGCKAMVASGPWVVVCCVWGIP